MTTTAVRDRMFDHNNTQEAIDSSSLRRACACVCVRAGAFGMAGCKLDSSLVNGRGFATLLSNMWKTWKYYSKPQECDVPPCLPLLDHRHLHRCSGRDPNTERVRATSQVVVEHPVFIITRFEAWNMFHQMGYRGEDLKRVCARTSISPHVRA
jgi:hypothetical protein